MAGSQTRAPEEAPEAVEVKGAFYGQKAQMLALIRRIWGIFDPPVPRRDGAAVAAGEGRAECHSGQKYILE